MGIRGGLLLVSVMMRRGGRIEITTFNVVYVVVKVDEVAVSTLLRAATASATVESPPSHLMLLSTTPATSSPTSSAIYSPSSPSHGSVRRVTHPALMLPLLLPPTPRTGRSPVGDGVIRGVLHPPQLRRGERRGPVS